MLLQATAEGPLVIKGEIQVDGRKYPTLRAALERGRKLMVKKGLIACAASQSIETTTEDPMAKNTGAKSVKGAKAAVKAEKQSVAKSVKPSAPKERDPRLPAPGSTIERKYKDKDLAVKVLEAGFEFEGTQYPSLTALALKITGAKAISGPAFFGLTKPQAAEAK